MLQTMSSLRRIILFSLIALVAATGCRSGGAAAANAGDTETTTIDIQNNDFYDMTVYAVPSGQRVRLGIAPGNKTTVLTIPRYLINGTTYLRFVADPIGGRRLPVTEEIDVSAGDHLVMIIVAGG